MTDGDFSGLTFATAPAAPETFNVLLYGRPKSGKSTAAATAPGPILWLNAEGRGALGYARKVAAELGTPILEVTINKKDRNCGQILDDTYRHIHQGLDPKPATVVVDTVAKVRDALIAEMVVPGAKNTLQQFGKVADKLGGFITAMRDLPVNLVLLAHVDVREDEDGGRMVDPLIGGKLTETIPGEVDVVAYTSAVSTDDGGRAFYGQLVEGKGRQGGDRSGGIADERGVRELDLGVWLGLYRAALTPVGDDVLFDSTEDADDGEVVQPELGEAA